MSRRVLTHPGRPAKPEPARPERPGGTGKAPAHRHGFRLSPGDLAREREAERYSGGLNSGLPATSRAAPKSRRPGGEPLPESLRALHELRLGRSLDELRMHDGPKAAREAGDLAARAFADGGDIVFADGRYRPDRPDGQALIAHEVAHAAQQADGRAAGPALQPEERTLTPGIPAPSLRRSEGGAVSASVFFAQGDFLLNQANKAALDELRRSLSGMLTGARVVIDAHASGEGSDAFNQELSEHRRMAVLALLTESLTTEVETSGSALGETAAGETETAAGGAELAEQRARNRRVDIVILPNWSISPDAPETERPVPDLTLPGLPPLPPPEPPWLRPLPVAPEPETFSVCGLWSDMTRRWFDRRLRDIGIGGDVREFLAERGVGVVEGLTFGAVGALAGEAGASQAQVKMIETTLEAACRQELRR